MHELRYAAHSHSKPLIALCVKPNVHLSFPEVLEVQFDQQRLEKQAFHLESNYFITLQPRAAAAAWGRSRWQVSERAPREPTLAAS